ncbi:hypothetical protein Hanom_Chr07g00643201 [Helianthus anomalus]
MHRPPHSENRITSSITELHKPLSCPTKKLENKTPVENHHFDKLVTAYSNLSFVAFACAFFNFSYRIQKQFRTLIASFKNLVKRAPFMSVHVT